MTTLGWIQIVLYVVVLVALAQPLGRYMARVYERRPGAIERLLGGLERGIYRACGIRDREEMDWKTYAAALLAFNVVGMFVVFVLLRVQSMLPWNPEGLPGVSPHLAFNTAVSFATNTNWQSYGGEATLGYLVQMLGLTVQNFVSAATGMAVLAAFVRGMSRHTTTGIGNFWADLTRGTLYVFLPLSFVLALALVSLGVVQTLAPYAAATPVQPPADGGDATAAQVIAVGPAASQVAIKQLGTNGGGFFNVNSAHPLENPTPMSNFLQVLAVLLVPAASTSMFGHMVRDRRQGRAVLSAMLVVFVPLMVAVCALEQRGNPAIARLGIEAAAGPAQPGGNMEGKETRFGIVGSGIWAAATTAASNGSVNSMHDSFTPLGGLIPMWLMQLGEVVFGGVGSGLYGMLVFAIVAVFVAGLMVGRTPEYLGKKIEAFEMKMAALVILVPAFAVLAGTAVAVASAPGRAGIFNPGPHGFSEVLYAFSSAGNNNGSAFAGLDTGSAFYCGTLAVAMLLGRYGIIVPVLAIAGSLARKKAVPAGSGTLPTHGPLFVLLLVGAVLLVGALTFVPALALGPIVEHLLSQ